MDYKDYLWIIFGYPVYIILLNVLTLLFMAYKLTKEYLFIVNY